MQRLFLRIFLATSLVTIGSCTATHRALPTATPAQVGLSRPALTRVDSLLESYVTSGKVAGIVGIVARNGRIAYDRSFGVMNVRSRKRLRSDAVFRIYSMTKPVLGAATMKLAQQGRLGLEDPVSKFIPAFADVKVYPSMAPDSVMKVRHLLTHTAGLSYGVGNTGADSIIARANLFDPSRTLAQFADSIATLPLLFSPGTAFNYSPAIDVLGRVIEVASGQPLDRYLEEELFEPLGMRSTSFRYRKDLDKRMTTLYSRAKDGSLREVTGGLMTMYEPQTRFFWGGGGLLSTIDDYLRFAQMLLNGGELEGKRILGEHSVAEMMRNQLPASLTPVSGPVMMDEGYGYGLAGAVLVDATRATLPGPAGIYRWSGYVGTFFWIDPVNNLIGMVWYQLNPGRLYPIEQEFQRLVYGALAR